MRTRTAAVLCLAALALLPPGAAGLEPPAGFEARDAPNDAGLKVLLLWDKMKWEAKGLEVVALGAQAAEGPFVELGRAPSDKAYTKDRKWPWWAWKSSGDRHFLEVEIAAIFEAHDEKLKGLREKEAELEKRIKAAKESKDKKEQAKVKRLELDLAKTKDKAEAKINRLARSACHFKLQVVKGKAVLAETAVVAVRARGDWFDAKKANNFLLMLGFSAVILVFIRLARTRQLFLRQIPGLAAIDEALGRATEMGKPVYYMTGREDFTKVSTIAAVSILGEVAKKTARFGTVLKVPHTVPLVYAVSEEVTRQAYTEAGRPDSYRDDINFFVTDDQFGYTAAVDGMMVRERPAAVIYMGYYYAESLVLAETGASIGAIQIAGTDADHQLPFFVTACEYCLIGEEVYAAGAYLSGDTNLIGTLRGQDVGKACILAGLTLGTVAAIVLVLAGKPELLDRLLHLVGVY